ncbi:uncharacterized protein LOC105214544 [Zeugodacus cucurbitae]|uniref:uncharacterized protein LOC105214544 n=1 Tax=Zeugodacus cucurbitae TaxID=28588 RepID=UPI0023D8EBDC|nr:uncharacterized protein LOC105214544 [Zeugodacus cucurbitae]
MLCPERKTIVFTLFALGIVLSVAQAEVNKLNLGNLVKNLLTNMERGTVWDEHLHFSLIFAEFIIKQKVRFYEPTRFENQLYEEILKRIATFRAKIVAKNGVGRLGNLLQKNVRLLKPAVIEDQIDTEFEYRTLKRNYDRLKNTGFPSSTLSDFCLLHISSLENCDVIEESCLEVISSTAPTYGYRRMHQILILYVLMHHTCAPQFGPPIVYEILSTKHCSEVYREHRLLAMSYSQGRRDLYIEQTALCSLFGFKEFLNKAEVRKIVSWDRFGICNCVGEISFYQGSNEKDRCKCADHSHSVALLFYVNAMLFLY